MNSISSSCTVMVILGTVASANAAENLSPTSLPKGLHGHRAHFIENRIYVFGGYGSASIVLDPKTHKWVNFAPMSVPKTFFSSVVIGGTIYAIGGQVSRDKRAVIEKYDGAKNRWKVVLRTNKLPKSHLSAAAVGHQIYIIGESPANTDHMHVFDTDTGKLSDAPPLPGFERGDHFHYMATLDGKLHVLGAMRFNPKTAMLRQHWLLDGGKWVKRAELPKPSMSKFGTYGVINGKLFLFNWSPQLHHVYDPKTDQWTDKLAPFPTSLVMSTAVADDAHLHVLGGVDPSKSRAVNTIRSFDVKSNRWNTSE